MSAGASALHFLYRGLRARWRDERAEIGALVGAIRPGDVAVDVGANKGSFLPSLSWAAGPGRVVAFEPQSALAEYVRRACRAARLTNVVVENTGVSDRAGIRTLHVPGAGGVSPGASFEPAVGALSPVLDIAVAVVTLDEYFRDEARRIAAIKIDVEGHELAVLRGAEAILARHAPIVVFECEARHVGVDGLRAALAFFAERGYGGWFVRRRRLVALEKFDSSVHQAQAGDRFWDAPGYCNNFVLRKAGG